MGISCRLNVQKVLLSNKPRLCEINDHNHLCLPRIHLKLQLYVESSLINQYKSYKPSTHINNIIYTKARVSLSVFVKNVLELKICWWHWRVHFWKIFSHLVFNHLSISKEKKNIPGYCKTAGSQCLLWPKKWLLVMPWVQPSDPENRASYLGFPPTGQ